jgi:uncharacterized protein
MRLRLAVIAAAAALILGPASSVAASFDCNRARSADEVAICQNRDLNDMDVRMAAIFDIAKSFVMMGQRGCDAGRAARVAGAAAAM